MHTIEAEHLTKDYGSGRGVFALVAAMGLIGYIIGSVCFTKKDLPL